MTLRRTDPGSAVAASRGVALGLGQVAVLSGVELLKPWPLQIVIDSVLGGAPPRFSALARASAASRCSRSRPAGFVLLWMATGAMAVLNNYTTISTGQAMVNDLRSDLYAASAPDPVSSTRAPASGTCSTASPATRWRCRASR